MFTIACKCSHLFYFPYRIFKNKHTSWNWPHRSVPAEMDPAEAWPRAATPRPRSGGAPESARLCQHRSSQEELPHVRDQGQQPGRATTHPRWGGQLRGVTPHPRSGGCTFKRRPRGATPRSRSEEVARRRYPSSKVRSSGCALLEQPWRNTPCPR